MKCKVNEGLARAIALGSGSMFDMKSSEAVNPKAKKPDQSLGRGVKTTLSPSFRMNTSRTEFPNWFSSGMVTAWEGLFQSTRAVD